MGVQPAEELLDFNREVSCFCGSSMVVSRRKEFYDVFVVCSRGCFDDMIREHPEYFMANYGVGAEYGKGS